MYKLSDKESNVNLYFLRLSVFYKRFIQIELFKMSIWEIRNFVQQLLNEVSYFPN